MGGVWLGDREQWGERQPGEQHYKDYIRLRGTHLLAPTLFLCTLHIISTEQLHWIGSRAHIDQLPGPHSSPPGASGSTYNKTRMPLPLPRIWDSEVDYLPLQKPPQHTTTPPLPPSPIWGRKQKPAIHCQFRGQKKIHTRLS